MKAKRKMPEQETKQSEPAQPDEAFQQAAQARILVENEKRQREQRCGMEVDIALKEIAGRNRCTLHFMEVRDGGQTTRMWLQPVAIDDAPG